MAQYTLKIVFTEDTDEGAEDAAAKIMTQANDLADVLIVASSLEKLIPAKQQKMFDPALDLEGLAEYRNRPTLKED